MLQLGSLFNERCRFSVKRKTLLLMLEKIITNAAASRNLCTLCPSIWGSCKRSDIKQCVMTTLKNL